MITKAARKALRQSRDALRALRLDPYYLGDEAWHYGQPAAANPFRDGTEEHADWKLGWEDAQFTAPRALGSTTIADLAETSVPWGMNRSPNGPKD